MEDLIIDTCKLESMSINLIFDALKINDIKNLTFPIDVRRIAEYLFINITNSDRVGIASEIAKYVLIDQSEAEYFVCSLLIPAIPYIEQGQSWSVNALCRYFGVPEYILKKREEHLTCSIDSNDDDEKHIEKIDEYIAVHNKRK